MKLISSAFEHNQTIPSTYTCDGRDVNPPLAIADVPANTKSLALIVDDPDAPAGTWVHWVVWNIDPHITEITENSVPSGATEGTTSFGKTGYGGPCPPSGTHRYFFKLAALDRALELSFNATAADLEHAMDGHVLASAERMGVYARTR
ncbi:MAG: YbhB/YbcL family Raf kinase inhibitor-like protein [Candidatus Kerfeldbacteria bacterium]|nr:YbhB/YbcL family Raf kinase inhibitor-like protein [Candidatus Kerfeldbacteria bacterium]